MKTLPERSLELPEHCIYSDGLAPLLSPIDTPPVQQMALDEPSADQLTSNKLTHAKPEPSHLSCLQRISLSSSDKEEMKKGLHEESTHNPHIDRFGQDDTLNSEYDSKPIHEIDVGEFTHNGHQTEALVMEANKAGDTNILDPHNQVTSKKDIKVKSALSWTSLAKTAMPVPAPIKCSSDSFQQFRKAALEKEQREKSLRAQEMKKQQLVLPDKDQKTHLQEKNRALDEKILESTLTKVLEGELQKSPESNKERSEDIQKTLQPCPERERDLARKREQERRRREAMAGTINMYFQSEIMATFEENLN
ncbi:bromodomain testis-specific protein-like [Ambystoma mexicanum]|uniref:bromodomain testis-specific protein-like n=1 Tax=Ambystoma mexicanum TaxID=8296 RepID=UPI0037E74083